jgi:hypothetical protein
MSEMIHLGPLDRLRDIMSRAEIIDEMIAEATDRIYRSEPDDAELRDLNEAVIELDDELSSLNMIGSQVKVRGLVLTMSADEERVYRALTMPPDREKVITTGTYLGFSIRTVSELEGDDCTFRLTHAVDTGMRQYENEVGHPVAIREIDYVCATGAVLEPLLPVNAHSLVDMANDPLLRIVEEVMLDSSMPDEQKVRYVGAKANQYIIEHHEDDFAAPQKGLNMQRASYLNETGLFSGLVLEATEVVIADNRQGFAKQDLSGCDFLDAPVYMAPEFIDLLPGYTWMPDGEIIPNAPPELYASVSNDDQICYVPLRCVTGVSFVDERAQAA